MRAVNTAAAIALIFAAAAAPAAHGKPLGGHGGREQPGTLFATRGAPGDPGHSRGALAQLREPRQPKLGAAGEGTAEGGAFGAAHPALTAVLAAALSLGAGTAVLGRRRRVQH